MFENIKLIIMDVDGTLTNSAFLLPDNVKKCLRKLHDQGILLGLASGRSVDMQLLKDCRGKYELGFDMDFLIGFNGSELWDKEQNKTFSYYDLKKNWIREIVHLMQPTGLNPYKLAEGKTIALTEFDYVIHSSKRNNLPLTIVSEDEFCSKDTYKILYPTPEERADEIMEYISHYPNDFYYAFKTQSTMIEFMDKRANKGVALQEFCKMHNIDLKDCMGFGDEENDNPFLSLCGYSVCLKNGGAKTKAICDDVTDKTNEEGGFADYIEKKFFKERS